MGGVGWRGWVNQNKVDASASFHAGNHMRMACFKFFHGAQQYSAGPPIPLAIATGREPRALPSCRAVEQAPRAQMHLEW